MTKVNEGEPQNAKGPLTRAQAETGDRANDRDE